MRKLQWLPDKLKVLAKTGTLDLSGEAVDDLSFVGSRDCLKKLDLSYTHLQTIEGLAFQPRIESLVLDGCDLANFKNFRAVQRASSISVRDTPVSRTPNFRLSLILVIGPGLRVINGQKVTEKLRERAGEFPGFASDLVNCGWLAEYPVPQTGELDKVAREFGLAGSEEMFEEEEEPEETQKSPPRPSVDELIRRSQAAHAKMVEDTERELDDIEKSSTVVDMIEDACGHGDLIDKVQALLKYYGYRIGETNRGDSILDCVAGLLDDPEEDEDE